MMNQLTLSEDRRELIIHDGKHRVTMRSARPEGFTDADLDYARGYEVNASMVEGQSNRIWRKKLGSWRLYITVNTGPPMWWRPRLSFRHGVMVGWLRALVAVKIIRRENDYDHD